MRENYRKSIESIEKLPQFTTMNVIDGQARIIICSSLIFYSLTIDNILNIIVLLLLAGVSITMLTGNNGILMQSTYAKERTRGGEVKEEVDMAINDNMMVDYKGGDKKSKQDVIDKLVEKGKLTEKEVEELKTSNIITIGGIEIDFSKLDVESDTKTLADLKVGDYEIGRASCRERV